MKSDGSMPLDLNGPFYSGFLAKKRDGNPAYGADEQACIEDTVAKLIAHTTDAAKPGILLGKIQSGKTKTFLGITALGFDNSYDIAVILTKPTTALAKQTCKRVAKEFAEFIEGDQVKMVRQVALLPQFGDFVILEVEFARGQSGERQRIRRACRLQDYARREHISLRAPGVIGHAARDFRHEASLGHAIPSGRAILRRRVSQSASRWGRFTSLDASQSRHREH